jgi:hypothetical protein
MKNVKFFLVGISLLSNFGIAQADDTRLAAPRQSTSAFSLALATPPITLPQSKIVKVDSSCGGWTAGSCRKCERERTPSNGGGCYVDRACDPC